MSALLRNISKCTRLVQNARSITIQSEEHGDIPDDKSVSGYLLEALDKRTGPLALVSNIL